MSCISSHVEHTQYLRMDGGWLGCLLAVKSETVSSHDWWKGNMVACKGQGYCEVSPEVGGVLGQYEWKMNRWVDTPRGLMMKGWWWWRAGGDGRGGQVYLYRLRAACIRLQYDFIFYFLYLFVCTWRRGRPVQQRCASPVYGDLQTSNSSLESSVCQYRQHGEAALALGQHQSQYLKTGSRHTWTHMYQNCTHIHTAGKPITAAHYWAGQVQVLTRATINPWILSGLLDVHSEQLTRLNVRAVASVMRQDNCAVFQPEQVNSHWPWG